MIVRTLRVAGILLLFAILCWLVHWLILFQRYARRKHFYRVYADQGTLDAARSYYQRICEEQKMMGYPVDEEFPERNEDLFVTNYQKLELSEYRRFIALIEKSVFVEMEWTEEEAAMVELFEKRVAQETFEHQSPVRRLIMKFWYAYI